MVPEKKAPSRIVLPAGHRVKGSVVTADYQIQTHKNMETVKHNGKKKTLVHAANHPKLELDLDFLPAAAESYHISPDPKDYILVSLPIVTADIPNRNVQCFPIEEICHFDPLYGQMVYQTFKHKPTHVDHCFAAGTKVRMEAGLYKNIEDIEPGDRVLTHNDRYRKVSKLFRNGLKKVMRIVPHGLNEILLTGNHPVQVVNKDCSDRHWKNAGAIVEGDYVCVPKGYEGSIEGMILREDYALTPVLTVEYDVLETEVFNLEVEDDHTYVANDIVVHNCNEDPTQAKGIHIDASMQYIKKYDLYKINVLTMWDRSKDPQLVKDILSKKRTGYSMGATVSYFLCSICGQIDNMDDQRCQHMQNIGALYGPQNRIAMQLCTGVCYFETSNLGNEPADPTAYSEDIFV